jgi:periplasmic divalent cation tolerance protein
MEKLCIVYITASDKEEAEKIGKEVVSRRLAACANIAGGITSFYRWEGKDERSEEAVLLIKTREALLPELKKAVKELHSYTCPCIEVIPVIDADRDYADWIISETKR